MARSGGVGRRWIGGEARQEALLHRAAQGAQPVRAAAEQVEQVVPESQSAGGRGACADGASAISAGAPLQGSQLLRIVHRMRRPHTRPRTHRTHRTHRTSNPLSCTACAALIRALARTARTARAARQTPCHARPAAPTHPFILHPQLARHTHPIPFPSMMPEALAAAEPKPWVPGPQVGGCGLSGCQCQCTLPLPQPLPYTSLHRAQHSAAHPPRQGPPSCLRPAVLHLAAGTTPNTPSRSCSHTHTQPLHVHTLTHTQPCHVHTLTRTHRTQRSATRSPRQRSPRTTHNTHTHTTFARAHAHTHAQEPALRNPLSQAEVSELLRARGADFWAVVRAADALRERVNGNIVTHTVNRNINYTNV